MTTQAMRHVMGMLGLGVLLTACAMGPDYERPAATIEDRYRMAESSVDAPSMANLPWWELLKYEQLNNLVQIALV